MEALRANSITYNFSKEHDITEMSQILRKCSPVFVSLMLEQMKEWFNETDRSMQNGFCGNGKKTRPSESGRR
jgi:hypothetical protein